MIALAQGTVVASFTVRVRIGVSGATYEARDARSGGSVALKVIEAKSPAGRAVLNRLRAASAIDHPSVAVSRGAGEEANFVYAAHAYVSGEPIDIAARSAAPGAPARWLAEVARALIAGHRLGVAHGAVHARNVLIDADGAVVVTNFAAHAGDAAADLAAWKKLAATMLDRRTARRVRAAASLEDAAAVLDTLGDPSEEVSSSSRPSKMWLALFALPLLAGVGLLATRRAPVAVKHTAVDARTRAKRAFLDLEPQTRDAHARSLYLAAMQATRDASFAPARRQLDEAIARDPSFASAHLRRALISASINESVRTHFARASDFRAQLDPRDRVLLDAFEPCMRAVPAPRESLARMERAVREDPTDADRVFFLGKAAWFAGEFARAEAHMNEALALDPSLIAAIYFRAMAQLDRGDPACTTSLDECIALSPAATTCLAELTEIERRRGDCAKAELLARRSIALEPNGARAYYDFAQALEGEERPHDAVRIAVDEYIARIPQDDRAREGFAVRARLAVTRGAFDEAERELRAWQKSLVGEPSFNEQIRPTDALIELLLETNRRPEAAEMARATKTLARAWGNDAIWGDLRLILDISAYRAGGLSKSELAAERARWLDEQNRTVQVLDELRRGGFWATAYGSAIVTRADAEEALRAYNTLPPMLSKFARDPLEFDVALGDAYLLAGRAAEAVPLLRAASASCEWLAEPIFHARAQVSLGQALEATGDRSGACAAYAQVLTRWSAARASVTLATARARASALRCDALISAPSPR